jgi:hypothetical protein
MHMPMQPSDLLLAIALLSAPVGTPEQAPTSERWPVMVAAVRWVAVDWEIMDEREGLPRSNPLLFQGDIDELRMRRIELAEAPRLNEAAWLPTLQAANNNITFNRAYRNGLIQRLQWEPDRADTIITALDETEQLNQMWNAIREAKSDSCWTPYRRRNLAELKRLMSEEDWQACVLPPYVPDWRFQQAR